MHLKKSDIRRTALIVAGVLLIAFNAVYYLHGFQSSVPLYDYTADNQTLYDSSFFDKETDQDAFIRMLVREKKVIYAREIRPYSEYPSYGHEHEENNPFSMEYCTENDYARYFEEYARETAVDTSLPSGDDVREAAGRHSDDFTYFGKGNDLLRYSFMVNKDREEVNNYFHYSWVYYSMAGDQKYMLFLTDDCLKINICLKNIADSDTLVALWDGAENLYLMPEKYYEQNIKGSSDGDK